MSIAASATAVQSALERISSMLDADGFQLHARVESGRLDVSIVATDAACADCLVPKELLGSMILDKLAGAGLEVSPDDVVLSYPSDLAH